ncbi:hypothetical protein NC651_005321 [Populus alba x Populus x berolinensis]|nr:hypothetical protein NC651_005321 [Populus alba x Populus x berolinensis]
MSGLRTQAVAEVALGEPMDLMDSIAACAEKISGSCCVRLVQRGRLGKWSVARVFFVKGSLLFFAGCHYRILAEDTEALHVITQHVKANYVTMDSILFGFTWSL